MKRRERVKSVFSIRSNLLERCCRNKGKDLSKRKGKPFLRSSRVLVRQPAIVSKKESFFHLSCRPFKIKDSETLISQRRMLLWYELHKVASLHKGSRRKSSALGRTFKIPKITRYPYDVLTILFSTSQRDEINSDKDPNLPLSCSIPIGTDKNVFLTRIIRSRLFQDSR